MYKVMIDVQAKGAWSDKANEEAAARVFGVVKDVAEMLRKRGIDVNICMMSKTTTNNNVTSSMDVCTHQFEYVTEDGNMSDVAYVKCIKCGSKYAVEDTVPDGTHKHALSYNESSDEIECVRCMDEFEVDETFERLSCQHQLRVDTVLEVAECTECGMICEVTAVGKGLVQIALTSTPPSKAPAAGPTEPPPNVTSIDGDSIV